MSRLLRFLPLWRARCRPANSRLRSGGPALTLLALGLALGLAPEQPIGAVGAAGASAVDPPRTPAGAVARVQAPPDPGAPGPYAVGVTRRTFTRTASGTGLPRTLDTVIWYPAAAEAADLPRDERLGAPPDAPPLAEGAPYPVVLFSHGSGGTPWQSTFLTTHLASHGFVVVAPPHPGNTAADCFPCLQPGPLIESAFNRPGDVVTAYEGVVGLGAGRDPLLGGLVDGSRAAVTGHSFGASTALQVGARDRRFGAVVAMAPPASAGQRETVLDAASGLTAPTLVMVGGQDEITPPAQARAVFEALPASNPARWLILFPRAGHFLFANRCPYPAAGCGPDALPLSTGHALVNRWVAAFLLRYAAADARYATLLDPAQAGGDPDIEIMVRPPGT